MVDIVPVGVPRRFEIRRIAKSQFARVGVNIKQTGIIAANDGIGHRLGLGIIRIRSISGANGGGVFRDDDLRRRDKGRRFVDIRDGDGHRLGGCVGPVRGLNNDFISVVVVGICGVFKVGRGDERQGAGVGVDIEQRLVGAAHDGVCDRLILGIVRLRRVNGRVSRILGHRRRYGRGKRRRLVDVVDGDQYRLCRGAGPVKGGNFNFIGIVLIGVGRIFEIRRRRE